MAGHAQLNLSWRNARRHKFAWRGSSGFSALLDAKHMPDVFCALDPTLISKTAVLAHDRQSAVLRLMLQKLNCHRLQHLLLPFASMMRRENKFRVFFFFFLVFEILEHLPQYNFVDSHFTQYKLCWQHRSANFNIFFFFFFRIIRI